MENWNILLHSEIWSGPQDTHYHHELKKVHQRGAKMFQNGALQAPKISIWCECQDIEAFDGGVWNHIRCNRDNVIQAVHLIINVCHDDHMFRPCAWSKHGQAYLNTKSVNEVPYIAYLIFKKFRI